MLSLSEESSGAALTAASTAALGPTAAPEEAPAPAESMSRAEPAAAGAVASFVLDSFQCPLTMEVMSDPVLTVDGQTYERTEIEKWFALGNRTSPLTGETLPSTNLYRAAECHPRKWVALIGMMGHIVYVSKNRNWLGFAAYARTHTHTHKHTHTYTHTL
jgi:hypothetical protein